MQAAAKAECAAIEREFSEYRAAQRSTPEADLVRQLADANEQVRRAEAKAEKATAAKQSYKEQVSCDYMHGHLWSHGHKASCELAGQSLCNSSSSSNYMHEQL